MLNKLPRNLIDKSFTVVASLSVVLLISVLFIVLGPMLTRGSKAILFKDTIEFRKLNMNMFNRGNHEKLNEEIEQVQQYRQIIYDMFADFKSGVDITALEDKAKEIYRKFGSELRYKNVAGAEFRQLRSLSRDIRNKLTESFSSDDRMLINENIKYVLSFEDDESLKDTPAQELFAIAKQFEKAIAKIDLAKREEYAKSLVKIEAAIVALFGPGPGEPMPALIMSQYGATRWDRVQIELNRLLYADNWVQLEPGMPLVNQPIARVEQFKGTKLEPLFGYVEQNIEKLFNPKFTFYWQYFIDDSTHGHYFGGVGPEILGTLLLTVMSMIFVIPLGVISAAYLIECATSDNLMIKVIRMSVNTLAGVPSIVFGLFGLAFFVLFLFPGIGFINEEYIHLLSDETIDKLHKPSILAASLTLALLTLPVMIRASEEAIRSVPMTYKEASLGLGASKFTTFVKVTLPAALPGILTGIILSLSRVAGETAPILFTGAAAFGPLPKSILDQTRTLSYGSYDIAVGDRLAMKVPHNQYGMVVTLIMLILVLNAVAIFLRSRASRKLKGM